MKSTVKVHGVGFNTDLNCFHHSPLPEASCWPMEKVADGLFSLHAMEPQWHWRINGTTWSSSMCNLGVIAEGNAS